MIKTRKILFLISAQIILLTANLFPADKDSTGDFDYLFFPRVKPNWTSSYVVGIGVTKLPTPVVEEEINTAPNILANYRLDLPFNFTFDAHLATNYISNLISTGLQFHVLNGGFVFSFGASINAWYGYANFESIKLKSYGFMGKPFVSAGIDFGEMLVTATAELQYGKMYTFSEGKKLAEFNQPNSSYTFKLIIEQPLWKKNCVVLGLGLNYATFYYQSWLSYSAIQEYLLYPEFYFGFII